MRFTLVALTLLTLPCIAGAESLQDVLAEKGVITKSASSAAAKTSEGKLYYKNGTTFDFADTGFSMKVNTQLQNRYEFTDNDSADNTSSFSTRRARMFISGKALQNEFAYKLQFDLVATKAADGSRSPALLDAIIDWTPVENMTLRMGQYKMLLSRQESGSDSMLQFVERSLASDYFAPSRAQGARVSYAAGSTSIAGGIFNGFSDGEGRNKPGVDTDHAFEVGIRSQLMGEMDPMEEGDIHRTAETAVNAGFVYMSSKDNNDVGGVLTESDNQRLSADLSVKSNGLAFHGEFYWADFDSDASSDSASPLGFYAQAGYMIGEKTELAGRFSQIDCDDGAAPGNCSGNDTLSEASASLNYYFWDHNLKAQFGYTWLDEDPADGGDSTSTNKWIFQIGAYV